MADKEEETITSEEVKKMLDAKFGGNTQIGGKGTMRRKKKVASHNPKADDKKLISAIKKYNMQPLNDIVELNMFMENNSIMHFTKLQVQYSFKESFVFVSGEYETKELKDLLPGIIEQVGPQHHEYLKKLKESMQTPVPKKEEEEIPKLVGTNFEEVSKKE
jgi:nascent polypeptide-associated complex subunit beta